jgi:uncharacterized membrane protein
MSFTLIVLMFAIGVIAGLRSMTAPAVVSWAAHLGWLALPNTHLALLGTTPAVVILTLFALAELIVDKLPATPNRTTTGPLVGRIGTGALCGAALCVAADRSLALGILLGSLGAIAGAFGGYQARRELVKSLRVPDIFVALVEDCIAVGGGFFIVSRLR